MAPLQLYFSFRSAFMNGQVCRLWEDQSEPTDRKGSTAAMADSNDILLLWVDIPGFYLPPILLVCCNDLVFHSKELTFFNSMRYSRMLEESSFANRRADYFWLLLQSSIMLLVISFHLSVPAAYICNLNSASPHSSTSPSFHHRLHSFRSTSGQDDIPQLPYRSSA